MAKCMNDGSHSIGYNTQIPEIHKEETMGSNCRSKLLRSVPIQKCLIAANLKIEVYAKSNLGNAIDQTSLVQLQDRAQGDPISY